MSPIDFPFTEFKTLPNPNSAEVWGKWLDVLVTPLPWFSTPLLPLRGRHKKPRLIVHQNGVTNVPWLSFDGGNDLEFHNTKNPTLWMGWGWRCQVHLVKEQINCFFEKTATMKFINRLKIGPWTTSKPSKNWGLHHERLKGVVMALKRLEERTKNQRVKPPTSPRF